MANSVHRRTLILLFLISFQAQANYWSQCQAPAKESCNHSTSALSKTIPSFYTILENGTSPSLETLNLNKNGEFSRVVSIPEISSGLENPEAIKIEVDPSMKFQEIWGFGGSITDSCLANLDKMSPDDRKKLMQDFFSRQSGAGFSYLRVPLGANDFSDGDYTLNDTKNNKPDPQLKQFDKRKLSRVMEFIKEAKAINPDLKVLVSPWTPPAWMKDNKKLRGGQLQEKYHGAYANYLAKSVEAFDEKGIHIDHMTILNEPQISWAKESWGFPQAYMSLEQQEKFLANNVAPLAKRNKKFPKILTHDHNWDSSMGSAKLFKNSKIKPALSGVATHCYGGDENTEKEVITSFRSTPVMNTECTATFSQETKGGNILENRDMAFQWWLRTQSIGAVRAGSAGALGWNLCLDETGGPQNNGCTDCRGLVTIDQKNKQKVIFNPEFHALAFTSRAVQNGAVRIHSSIGKMTDFSNVAFRNPDGKIVVLVHNQGNTKQSVSLKVRPCSHAVQFEVPPHSASQIHF